MRIAPLAGAVVLTASLSACSGASANIGPEPSFSPNPKHSELVAKAKLDRCPPSQASSVAGGLPDVTLPCLGKGPDVHLSGLVGTPLVVNIWGSWCGPCKAETRYFAQAYDALKGRVRFLGVDDEDDPDSALDFAPHVSPPMRYPSVVDDDKKVLVALHGPVAVPSTVFVDASGKVVRQVSSAYSSLAQLRADISHYLGVSS
jgi:thiol-disulfide isomerase/thioredoxin